MIYVKAAGYSSRLRYVLDWLGGRLGVRFVMLDDGVDAANATVIEYGMDIPDSGLLWEKGVRDLDISLGDWDGLPVMFLGDGAVPFDLFSAVFWCLSRYEEYLPFAADKHGRYPHEASVLWQQGWLRRPIVDEWVARFGEWLGERFGVVLKGSSFSFLLTYDIDIAYSYKGKGLIRNVGGGVKDLMRRDWNTVAGRLAVLSGIRRDDYDAFEWLESLHRKHNLPAQFFVLAAMKTGAFDKNISPLHPAMLQLLRGLKKYGNIGLHPSYNSSDAGVFERESAVMSSIAGKKIVASRQHYIRMTLPKTYQRLLASGIEDDWSMGYGGAVGFRAGTGCSFWWYDLDREAVRELRVHPFCFMDSTARFNEGWGAEKAFEVLEEMVQKAQSCGSGVTTVFHNFSLGTDDGWKGWREGYEAFVRRLATS